MWYYVQSGQQAGPVSQEQLVGYFQDGTVLPNTLVWRKGMANWLPANEVAELAGTGSALAEESPPDGPASATAIYAPGQSALQQPGTPYGAQWQTPRTCGLAVWSLVLSIVSLICCGVFLAIPAIICGHNARSQIRNSPGALSGDGMALAGLIIGYISIVLHLILVVTKISNPTLLPW